MATSHKLIAYLVVFMSAYIAGFAFGENQQTENVPPNSKMNRFEINFTDVKILPSEFGGYEFVGHIRNESTTRTILSIAVKIVFYDYMIHCDNKNIAVIGERTESIYLTIPPKQEKKFREPIYLYGDLLNLKGDLVWAYHVLSIRSD